MTADVRRAARLIETGLNSFAGLQRPIPDGQQKDTSADQTLAPTVLITRLAALRRSRRRTAPNPRSTPAQADAARAAAEPPARRHPPGSARQHGCAACRAVLPPATQARPPASHAWTARP